MGITWSLSLKSLSKAGAEITGTAAKASAMDLPMLLSGAISPSWKKITCLYIHQEKLEEMKMNNN